MICGIYKIESPSGKCYIGQSVNIDKRIYEHKRQLSAGTHCNRKLQNAYNKYKESLMWEVLEVVPKEDLTNREQFWIDELDAVAQGYNICKIAAAPPVRIFDAEQRERLSESVKSLWGSQEYRQHMSCVKREKIANDPDYRQRLIDLLNEGREKNNTAHKAFMKQISNTKESKERFKEAMQNWRESLTPYQKAEIAEKCRKTYADKVPRILYGQSEKAMLNRLFFPDTIGISEIAKTNTKGACYTIYNVRWAFEGKDKVKQFSSFSNEEALRDAVVYNTQLAKLQSEHHLDTHKDPTYGDFYSEDFAYD